MRITYKAAGETLAVYLEKRRVGTIRPVVGGFAYYAKGQKRHGQVFGTEQQVKASLKAE